MDFNNLSEEIREPYISLIDRANQYIKLGYQNYVKNYIVKARFINADKDIISQITTGMQQICMNKGFSSQNPFENLGIDGFYTLFEFLDYICERQEIENIEKSTVTDKMIMRHKDSKNIIILYNNITYNF